MGEMAAPDATPPDPLRQAFRRIVPRPVRAALHDGAVGLSRLPAFVARQTRRAGWGMADAMSTRRQPGLFFWHLSRAPSRIANAMRHANWEAQRSARHAGLKMAHGFNPFRWLLRREEASAPDQPSFGHALARMQQHQLGIRSIINIGAGSGGDTEFVQRVWADARTLLIEMDAAFEDAYRELKRAVPGLSWDICAAGPEDKLGRMQKTDIGGVGGALDLEGAASAGGADVQVKRIDTLVREHGLEAPYFLRFDTHGFELDILAGATETMRQTALVMMECYNFKLGFTGNKNLTFDEMVGHMRGLGFRCIDICDPLYRPGDGALWQMHLFFIRADHPLFSKPGFSAPGASSDA